MTPLFSIIIPVYNVAPYLRDCLDSVLAQTFTDWEAVCVDDGSIDESPEILDSYASKDSRIRVIHQKNGGVSAARNAGLRCAVGEYILFLDGDDLLKDTTLQSVSQLIQQYQDIQIFSFRTTRFRSTESPVWSDIAARRFPGVKAIRLSESIAEPALYSHFAEKVYARNIVPVRGFLPYAHGEDLLFLVESVCCAAGAVLFNETCYAYRARMGSATSDILTSRAFSDRLGTIPEFFRIFSRARKIPARFAVRERVAIVVYSYVSRLLRMPKSQRKELWLMWYALLSETLAAGNEHLTCLERVVLSLLLHDRSKCIVMIFVCLPIFCARIARNAMQIPFKILKRGDGI